MPEISEHAPGSFCWFELGTTDQSAAKEFYSSLFGWSSEDFPMGPGGVYTMLRINGRDVGATYTLNANQRAQGVPPNWGVYIAAENADASAQRARELGANVLAPPFDVMEHGRMAVVADPTGAVFFLWQPKQHAGVGVTGVDGTVCWVDLTTPDPDAAKQFYSQLFGWRITPGEHDPSGYLHIFNGSTGIGGIPPADASNPPGPAHWLVYFLVSDCAATFEKATGLGAGVLLPTMEMPKVGTMAILKDPQGAVFALYQSAK